MPCNQATGRPVFNASDTSLRVPHPPPMAINAELAVTITVLRACPRPVAIAVVR
jgi:hypothetical protein